MSKYQALRKETKYLNIFLYLNFWIVANTNTPRRSFIIWRAKL